MNEFDLVRDYSNNSLINNNKKAYENAMKIKEQKKKDREEIDTMKQDLSEIKILLQQLIKEKNG